MFNMQIDGVQIKNLFDFELAWESLPFLLKGIPMTLSVSLIGMALGLILGFFLALARGSERIILRWPARVYISFMRGTPILVFLFIRSCGVSVLGLELSSLVAA